MKKKLVAGCARTQSAAQPLGFTGRGLIQSSLPDGPEGKAKLGNYHPPAPASPPGGQPADQHSRTHCSRSITVGLAVRRSNPVGRAATPLPMASGISTSHIRLGRWVAHETHRHRLSERRAHTFRDMASLATGISSTKDSRPQRGSTATRAHTHTHALHICRTHA